MKIYFSLILVVCAFFNSTGQILKGKPTFKDFHPIGSEESPDSAYLECLDSIFMNQVPERGKSIYFAGEMLRILYNTKGEAQRNGNINWDKDYKKGLKFIRRTLVDSKLFPSEIVKEIKRDVKRLGKFRRPYTDDEIYDRLLRRIVEYHWNFKNIKIE